MWSSNILGHRSWVLVVALLFPWAVALPAPRSTVVAISEPSGGPATTLRNGGTPPAGPDEPGGDAPVDVPGSPLKFHRAAVGSARSFLDAFIPYTESVEAGVESLLNDLGEDAGYGALSEVSKKVRRRHTRQYKKAMSLATAHHQDFKTNLAPQTRPDSTYIHIYKSLFLAFLVDQSSQVALAVFPIATGVRSNLGPKGAKGDLRSPESAEGHRSWKTTPFFAHPLVAEDPFPTEGCIERGIGVCSLEPTYSYLATGWTVMLHGTPDRQCIGTRASHGCIRLLPEHIRVLFDHIVKRTKIVVAP